MPRSLPSTPTGLFFEVSNWGERKSGGAQPFSCFSTNTRSHLGPFSVDSLPFAVSIGLVFFAVLQICRHLWPSACCCPCSFLLLCCCRLRCQPALRLCQDLRCSLSSLSRRGNPLVAARRKLYKTYNKTELSQHVSLPTPPFIFMWLGHPPTPVLLSLPPAPPPIRPYSKNTLLHLLLLRFLWLKNIGLCCKVYSIFNEWFDLIYLHALLWSSVCLSDLNTHSKFQLICSCSLNNILCHHVIHTSHFASLK